MRTNKTVQHLPHGCNRPQSAAERLRRQTANTGEKRLPSVETGGARRYMKARLIPCWLLNSGCGEWGRDFATRCALSVYGGSTLS